MSSEPVELVFAQLHKDRETDASWCVSEFDDTFEKEAERIFLPKSQCEYEGEDEEGLHQFKMPEWLAIEKGLV